MELNAEENKFIINKLIGKKTKTVSVEGNIIIPDIKPDILNTIDSTGNICIYKKDVMDGKVKIDGGINLYLIYLADSDSDMQRGLNTTLDFSQIIEIEECKSNMNLYSLVKVNKIETSILNGRKIKVKVEIEIIVQIYCKDEIKFLNKVENDSNMQILKERKMINTLIGQGETKLSAKDTITYSNADKLVEILKANINIINKETKISYNKVLIKADLDFKILYLSENGDMNILNSSIPAVGFIDIPNISDENLVITNYEIRNIIIKPNIDEFTIDVDAELGASCMVYATDDLELVQDMYSIVDDIEFTTNCIETETNKNVQKSIFNMNESITIPEISNNKIYDVDIIPKLNNVKVMNKRIIYDGEVLFSFLYNSNNHSGTKVEKYVCPFNFEVDNDNIKNTQIPETEIECLNSNYTIISDGNINCKLDLQFNTNLSDVMQIKLIDKVSVLNKKEENKCSMVVHIIKPDDTLWNIAKKYKTTVKSIMETNLIDNDNLNIGDKLYIQNTCGNLKDIA